MISVQNLSLRFGSFLLRDINLEIDKGEFFVLLGPSGSGKYLLLETILGIRPPEQGEILLEGRNITHLAPEKRDIAYVPQDLGLFPHLNPRENILFGVRIRKVDRRTAEKRLAYLTPHLKLDHLMTRTDLSSLSGGEKQRVAFARALITKPRVLFLDEPFSSLDTGIRRSIQFQLKRLQKAIGLTVFHVTHDQEEAFLMADKMAIMIDGRIEQWGKPELCYNRPANAKVASFLLMENIFDAEAIAVDPSKGILKCRVGSVVFEVESPDSIRTGEPFKLGIRPEEILIIPPGRVPGSPLRQNFFQVRVESLFNLGSRRTVRLVFPGREGLSIDATFNHRITRSIMVTEGDRVFIHLRPRSFCILGSQ